MPIQDKEKNKKLLVNIILITIGMFALAYASVPLYNIFCKATGYGGTVKEEYILPQNLGKNELTIFFDANIDKNLPWEFYPETKEIRLLPGEEKLVFYIAENLSNEPITGHAIYNVTPFKAGNYFVKIECFCFENQTLQPKEKIRMPVLFYIDPEIENDQNTLDVRKITLSYSFMLSNS